MEDILPNAYISDSVLLSRNSLKSNIKTDDCGRMLLDLCISSQCRILNGRTLGDTIYLSIFLYILTSEEDFRWCSGIPRAEGG